ncbi:MAG: type II toxin-antitoxin system VapC family toxin [Armatimonadota bacterium]
MSGGLLPGDLALLDTGVLVHLLRPSDPIAQWIESSCALSTRSETPLLATVVEAEVLAIARYNKWGERRLQQLRKLLDELVRVEMDRPQIIDAYAELYCVARSQGQAIHDPNQNDLWIAATARATDSVLLTQDPDFDFLHPAYIRIVKVPLAPP